MPANEPLNVVHLMLDRLYTGEGAFHDPKHLLKGLTPEQAVTVPEGCHHSIALAVEHMNYWLRLYLGWLDAGQASEQSEWGEDFLTPPAAEWPRVLTEFQALAARVRSLATEPDLATRRVKVQEHQIPAATLLSDLGGHNAYHLGQVVLIRRLIGAWPPTK